MSTKTPREKTLADIRERCAAVEELCSNEGVSLKTGYGLAMHLAEKIEMRLEQPIWEGGEV